MNVVKCSQGHFYDADKFTICPHCGAQKREVSGNESISISRAEETVALKEEEIQLWENNQKIPKTSAEKSNRSTSVFFKKKRKGQVFQKSEHSIQDEIISIPTTSLPVLSEDIPTRSLRYTVGWIVYINGTQKGSTCELKTGNNFIGVGEEMDIQIQMDLQVACKYYAKIVFEPNKQEFFLAPGETSELVYLGKEVLMLPQKLMPYDEILIGDTKLLFVPLCGKEFIWQGENN